MIRKHAFVISILLSALILFIVIRMPMTLVAGLLPAKIRLVSCEGSLWQGRAAAVGLGGQVTQENVTWQFLPGALLAGKLGWAVNGKFNKQSSKLTLLLMPNDVEVRDVNLVLPAESLFNLHNQLKALRLGGLLHIQTSRFSLQSASTLNTRLEKLFSPLAPATGPLGNYHLELITHAGKAGEWQLQTQEGILAVSGQGTLDANKGTITGRLALKPQESTAANLRPMLALLQQGTEGNYTIELGQ